EPAGRGIPGELDYPTPEPDFALSRIDLAPGAAPVSYRPDGPEVLLCTAGVVRLTEGAVTETLEPGRAAWVPASTPRVTLAATDGATVFRTRVGEPATGTQRA